MRSGPCAAAAQQGADLRAEGLGVAAAAAAGRAPPAPGWGCVGPPGARSSEAHVPGAHGDRVRAHLVEQPAVDLDLPLLAGPFPRAAQQVLGAEEADPLRAVRQRGRRLVGELDVGLQARRPRRRAVTAGRVRVCCRRSSSRRSRSCAARKPASAGPEGSTTTSPARCRPRPPGAPGGIRRVASPQRRPPRAPRRSGPGSRCGRWRSRRRSPPPARAPSPARRPRRA